MTLKMLLSLFLLLTPAVLSSSIRSDANIKQYSENVITTTTISTEDKHIPNFGENVTYNNPVFSEHLSVENVASETKDLIANTSKYDSCISQNGYSMATNSTPLAQIPEENYNSEESEGSEINYFDCPDSSSVNSFVNGTKMEEIQYQNQHNNESFTENVATKLNKDIRTDKIQLKKETINTSEKSNDFAKTLNFDYINYNQLTEDGRTKNKNYEFKSLNNISNEFKINSNADSVKSVHVKPRNENTETITENSNGFINEPEVNISETSETTISVHKAQAQKSEDNPDTHLLSKNLNGYTEVIRDIQNLTVGRIHDLVELQKNNTLVISKRDSIEGSSNIDLPKDGTIGILLNSTDNSMVIEQPKFAMLKEEQQSPTRRTEKQISVSKLEFPEVPEGDSFHIQELGLSEGIFVFSYLSQFLSWIQPYDFPVELLRDALWNRVSVVDLITQSLPVEVGFIVCLTVGVLLALGVPCILIAHACCRLLNSSKRNSSWSEDSSSETTDNCAVNFRRCTLVFVVQLILLLLVAGIVSMFVTNEQMSRAVDQTPSVVHTALNDVTTFLRNSHHQLQFVITKSLDQAVDAAYTDLDNVEELLGRPIQAELAEETGIDVALDALVDVSTAARTMSGKVEDLLTSCMETRGMIMESREQLADLRMQVDMFRQQCTSRFRPLCNTVNASGLDVVLRLDGIMSDDRLVQIRELRDGNLSLVTQQARGEFQYIPLRVEKDTRDARNGVKRQLSRQKEVLDSSIWSLDVVTRDLTYKIENARNQALQIVQGVSAIEQWRWITGLGAALSVLLLWILLLSGITCGCCGAEERAAPTLLASVVLMCLFSIILWAVALCALLIGGHGEVFICRPLYDEPGYSALTRLVDQPGILFQRGGGFFSNLLYGNSTMDVPLKDVLQKCQGNGSTYSAFKLKQVFDVDSASNHQQWDLLHSELSRLQVNLSNMVLLTPELQHQLQELLQATTVNITNFRAQMTGQVTGKDLTSFADQMTSVANQITDWATLNRLENLISTTRNIFAGHIQPLEQRKEDLVYQLTALEMQLAPLQRQVNQSLSHLKTIQYYINNQGDNIAYQKSHIYISRLIGYMDQYRAHVLNRTQHYVAPCRPVWNLYHTMRLLLCRHIMDPLNGFWFATVWCLLLFLAATPPCLKLMDHYKHLKHNSGLLRSRSSESPSETLMIPEQGAPWSTPGAPENDGW